MKILFLMIEDFEFQTRSHLFSDLALELADRGNSVTVVVPSSQEGIAPYRLTEEKGVRVLRVFAPNLFNVGFVRKGIANVLLPWRIRSAMKAALAGTRFDLLLYYTPPIFYASLVQSLKRKLGARSYLILRDIFPQNAVDLGILKYPFLFSWFRRIERKLYANSDRIGCMSQGNIDYIRRHNPEVPASKLELLPNWKKVRQSQADPSAGAALIRKWGLEGKFIAVFGGVMGVSQDLDFVLDYAKTVPHLKDVVFLLIGEGNRKAHLIERVRQEGITNVRIQDKITRTEFDSLLRNCQLGLVNLARFFTIPNIPSKILDYLDAGIPTLAAVDPNTDYGKIIEGAGAGLWCLNGDLDAYGKAFMRLYSDPELRHRMGESGRAYLLRDLTVEKAADTVLAKEHLDES